MGRRSTGNPRAKLHAVSAQDYGLLKLISVKTGNMPLSQVVGLCALAYVRCVTTPEQKTAVLEEYGRMLNGMSDDVLSSIPGAEMIERMQPERMQSESRGRPRKVGPERRWPGGGEAEIPDDGEGPAVPRANKVNGNGLAAGEAPAPAPADLGSRFEPPE
jgi:hypothetical protein